MSFKLAAFCVFSVLAATSSEEATGRRHRYEDPFAMLDKHISHTLTQHYLWPWNQLLRAAAALDIEDALEEPQIIADDTKFEVNMNVKRFKPEELRVKVKNRYIMVEGKTKPSEQDQRFISNHFVQRFVLPPGTKGEEVKAVLKENNVLSISAPRHEVPPPPPEREVPIEVLQVATTTKADEKIESTTASKVVVVEGTATKAPYISTTAEAKLEEVESTTHVGKIRKKELKTNMKPQSDNEVSKVTDGNGLDYALIDNE